MKYLWVVAMLTCISHYTVAQTTHKRHYDGIDENECNTLYYDNDSRFDFGEHPRNLPGLGCNHHNTRDLNNESLKRAQRGQDSVLGEEISTVKKNRKK